MQPPGAVKMWVEQGLALVTEDGGRTENLKKTETHEL